MLLTHGSVLKAPTTARDRWRSINGRLGGLTFQRSSRLSTSGAGARPGVAGQTRRPTPDAGQSPVQKLFCLFTQSKILIPARIGADLHGRRTLVPDSRTSPLPFLSGRFLRLRYSTFGLIFRRAAAGLLRAGVADPLVSPVL